MAMLFVIPAKKLLAKGSGILEAAEPAGKLRAVLECFKMGLRVRVIITDIWTVVGLGHPQVREQKGYWL